MESFQIDVKHNQAEILVSSKIYERDVVVRAASELMGDCWVTVNEQNGNFVVAIKPKNQNDKVRDFLNLFTDFLIVYKKSLKGDSVEL